MRKGLKNIIKYNINLMLHFTDKLPGGKDKIKNDFNSFYIVYCNGN